MFDGLKVLSYPITNGELTYFSNAFNSLEADNFLKLIIDETEWKQPSLKIFGRKIKQPRLSALYADNKIPYTYSKFTHYGLPWKSNILKVKEKVQKITDLFFNSALVNYYRDGQDSMGWHSDNEPELGKAPIVASVSFGEARKFNLKHRSDKNLKESILLDHGSILLMSGDIQNNWLHQISKSKKSMGPRINITFRTIEEKIAREIANRYK
jgi:alkylated DNA repair dioxygenase AlkB